MRKTIVLVVLLHSALMAMWAGGAREVDTVLRMEGGETYISPVSEQADKRSLVVKDIGLQIDSKGAIKQYRFTVFSRSGKPVFEQTESNLEQRGAFAEAFGIGEVPQVSLPKAMEWKAVDSAGKQVPDGEYLYQLSALDSWGTTVMAAPLTVVVDTKGPELTRFALSGRMFSPDGDGKRDTLAIQHVTGPAYLWNLQVLDGAGAVVWEKKWQASGTSEKDDLMLSGESVWRPGENAGGAQAAGKLAEGKYKVVLTGFDRAGNKTLQNRDVEISYTAGQGMLAVDGDRSIFSPRDGVVLLPRLDDKSGALAWKIEVIAADGAVWRRIEGKGPAPERIAYAGTGQAGLPWSDSGRIPDGTYRFGFEQTYDTGAVLSDTDLVLSFDATPPVADIRMTIPEIEAVPNRVPGFGDPSRPRVLLEAKIARGDRWDAVLTRAGAAQEQKLVFALDALLLPAEGEAAGLWDGSLPDGQGKLPDGVWDLYLAGRDGAGNEGRSNTLRFVYAAGTPGPFEFSASKNTLALAYAEQPEAVEFRLVDPGRDQSLVDHHELVVVNQAGEAVFRKSFLPGDSLLWYGQRTNGLMTAPGAYEARVETGFMNGGLVLSAPCPVEVSLVDTANPGTAQVAASGAVSRFLLPRLAVDAPAVVNAGEGTPFDLGVQGLEGSSIEWRLTIRDPAGAPLWEQTGKGSDGAMLHWTSPAGLPGELFDAVLELAGPDDTRLSIAKALGTAIPVQAEGQRLRILVPSILFDGNRADSLTTDDRNRTVNTDLLRRLGSMLKDLKGYRILIEGHATYVTGTTALMQKEQELELIPLSRERAMEVKKILFMMGVDWASMDVAALGGTAPVVDPADTAERWQNRRVSLYLVPVDSK